MIDYLAGALQLVTEAVSGFPEIVMAIIAAMIWAAVYVLYKALRN